MGINIIKNIKFVSIKKSIFTLIASFFAAQLSAQIEVNSTGVGIGTTNPQYLLDVYGNARVAGNIYLRTSGLGVGVSNPQYPLDVSGDARISGNLYLMSSRLGIGTVSPQYPLDVSGDARIGGYVYLRSTGVGIGVANPQYSLEVAGHVRVEDIYLGGGCQIISPDTYGITFKVNNQYAGYTGYALTSNVSFGYQALNNQGLGGWSNVAFGYQALYANTTGNFNVGSGFYALSTNTTGEGNTATGHNAMRYNTFGSRNTATGKDALASNISGAGNTAIGYGSLVANTTGTYNTAVGFQSLRTNASGNHNIAIGYQALYITPTNRSYNIAIGSQSHYTSVAIGDENILIGRNSLSFGSNSIAIGSSTMATASDQARIGNNTMTSIGGQVAWSTFSDGRTKRNIQANVPGLSFICRLQPVTYNLDLDAVDALFKIGDPIMQESDSLSQHLPIEIVNRNNKARANREQQLQTGFVAQEVETVAKSLGYDFSGVEVDELGIYSLRYGEFVVPLVKAVQELSEQNERLQKQVTELTQVVNKLLGAEKVPEAASITQNL